MLLKWIQIYCKLVENKSFTKTAEDFFVTQPSISSQITQLEKHFNIDLINRSTKKFSLTKAGEIFYHQAKKVINQVSLIDSLINDYKGLKSGELTIGTSTLPGEYILPSIISNYKRNFPEISIKFTIKDTFKIIDDIEKGLIDIGFVGSKTDSKNLNFQKFFSDEIVLINSNKNFKDKITLNELYNIPLVIREDSSGTLFSVKKHLEKSNFDFTKTNIMLQVATLNGLKQILKTGLGLGFMSKISVADELDKKIFKIVNIENITPIRRDFFILTSNQFSTSPAAIKFKEFLISEYIPDKK